MSGFDRLLADLDRLPTEAVPEAIGQLARLEVLWLHNNQLSALPEANGRIAVGLIGTKAVSGLPQHWRDLANKHIGTSSYPLIVIPIVVLAVLFAALLHFTPFGRGVFEIGLNAETAHFSGVDVRRSKLLLHGDK